MSESAVLGCCICCSVVPSFPEMPEVTTGAVQGYAHYLAVAEWYTLRTPFTQWYTKNYSSVF